MEQNAPTVDGLEELKLGERLSALLEYLAEQESAVGTMGEGRKDHMEQKLSLAYLKADVQHAISLIRQADTILTETFFLPFGTADTDDLRRYCSSHQVVIKVRSLKNVIAKGIFVRNKKHSGLKLHFRTCTRK